MGAVEANILRPFSFSSLEASEDAFGPAWFPDIDTKLRCVAIGSRWTPTLRGE